MSKFIVRGILNNYNFCILKKKYPKIIIERIKNKFTVSPPKDMYNEKTTIFKIFYEDDDYLIIPKFYSYQKIDISDTKLIINGDNIVINNIQFECKKASYNPKSINIRFTNPKSPNKPLRDYQQNAIDYILKLFNDQE